MRRAFLVFAALGMLLAVSSESYGHFRPHGSFGISFNVFYESLSPYGEWIAVDGGVYAWRPLHISHAWRPYTFGRWVWTDDGWYWVSDEPWGWAAYHYGRWYYDDYYGWMWIPGYEWAPAWVEWRYGGDYIGWAPLGPYAVFSISFGIYYRTHWMTPHYYWTFVGCGYITAPSVHRYAYRTEHNTRYIGRTRHAGSVRYDGRRIVTRGPDRTFVESRGNVRLERLEVRDVDSHDRAGIVRTGDREQISVYRPKIDSRTDDAAAERPQRVREVGRKIDLDTRKIDVRSREEQRSEGRDVTRHQEYRVQREDTRIQMDRTDGRGVPPTGGERRGGDDSRTVDRRGDTENRRSNTGVDAPRSPQPERQVDRQSDQRNRDSEAVQRPQPRREEFRSPTPERTERRPEVRQESRGSAGRSEPQRSGGSRSSGDSRGGRRQR